MIDITVTAETHDRAGVKALMQFLAGWSASGDTLSGTFTDAEGRACTYSVELSEEEGG